jgi:hypothetical protein
MTGARPLGDGDDSTFSTYRLTRKAFVTAKNAAKCVALQSQR